MIRILPLCALLLLLFLGSLPAVAGSFSSPAHSLDNPLLGMEIVDASGTPQEIVLRRGRLVADLVEGEAYALRLTNKSNRRVKVVVSIDGINPRNGTRAFQGQGGVILPPKSTQVLATGRPSRRSPEQPLLPLKPEVGTISLMTLQETGSYPMMGVGFPPAPREPENFRINAQGEREWIPPADYPFRRDETAKPERTYMEYDLVPRDTTP